MTTQTEKINEKARTFARAQNTETLVESFEELNPRPMSPEIATARGWIMDILEERNPEAFDLWLESGEESPRAFFFPQEPQPAPDAHLEAVFEDRFSME